MLGLWHSPCMHGHPSCFLQSCTQHHMQGQPDQLYSDTPHQDSAATEEVKWGRNHQRPLAEGAISAHREHRHREQLKTSPLPPCQHLRLGRKYGHKGSPWRNRQRTCVRTLQSQLDGPGESHPALSSSVPTSVTRNPIGPQGIS